MRLYSTKKSSPDVDLKEAVLRGLPPDNGLYMPYDFPKLADNFWKDLSRYDFNTMAKYVVTEMLGGVLEETVIHQIIDKAYDFDAPLVPVGNSYILELFHGPTLAFKDFGARFMGQLMGHFLKDEERVVNILVATSGDTGSAVAHGFLNVPGIKVTILYPKGKVSDIQEKQFTTLGANITALEIDGTFDDCQALVKQAFLDKDLNEKIYLSSANSINIARLIPQSLYYIYAYKQLENKDKALIFSIPSGNFGNLTAGLFAKKMGLPISRIIASTNSNDIFTHYLKSGEFSPKPSVKTISNAMDVGNPSNFARIMDIYGDDLEKVKTDISAYSFSDNETAQCIKEVYQKYNYLMCTHTAVGYLGMDAYLSENPNSASNNIVLSTAHPVKFSEVVEPIIEDVIAIPERLKKAMGTNKMSTPMSADFNSFKNFLFHHNA
jgi:threonine synthase